MPAQQNRYAAHVTPLLSRVAQRGGAAWIVLFCSCSTAMLVHRGEASGSAAPRREKGEMALAKAQNRAEPACAARRQANVRQRGTSVRAQRSSVRAAWNQRVTSTGKSTSVRAVRSSAVMRAACCRQIQQNPARARC